MVLLAFGGAIANCRGKVFWAVGLGIGEEELVFFQLLLATMHFLPTRLVEKARRTFSPR